MMPKTKRKSKTTTDTDGAYLLKLVLYVIVASQWLWLVPSGATYRVPIPFGLLVGIAFASHEHFKIDRKVEYAVMLVAVFIGFVANIGLSMSL
jgi:hypothetical protein